MIYTITLNPAIDRLIFLTEELTKRKTNRASRVLYDIGGKGTHGSYAMSKLGVDNLALGFAGKENKNKFYQVLEDKKINHHFFLVDRSETRESIVMIDPNNKGSTMVTEPSLTISRNKKEDLLNYLQKNLTAEDFVLIAGSLPNQFTIDDLAELMETVKKANSFLACDLSGEALKVAISKKVDFIKPNEFELKELLKEGETVDQKIIELSAKVRCLIASQGKEGSICCYKDKRYLIKAPQVEEVNDTGAGDCFVGSFLAVLYKTQDIEEALRTASACAASKVQYEDSSYFSLEDVKELRNQVKIIPLA